VAAHQLRVYMLQPAYAPTILMKHNNDASRMMSARAVATCGWRGCLEAHPNVMVCVESSWGAENPARHAISGFKQKRQQQATPR
jgi:hypothetical protein